MAYVVCGVKLFLLGAITGHVNAKLQGGRGREAQRNCIRLLNIAKDRLIFYGIIIIFVLPAQESCRADAEILFYAVP